MAGNFIVIKRDGRRDSYDRVRIETALAKAMQASKDRDYAAIASKLTKDIETELKGLYPNGIYNVEDIQDQAERALMSHGFYDAARAFIRYRAVHENIRNIRSAEEFCEQTITGYTGEPDVGDFLDPGEGGDIVEREKNWHVKQNASVSYSVGAMILNNSERISKAHWLTKFYDKEIVDAYRNGAIHIHDLGMLTGYCAGWDLKKLIKEGLGGVPGKISSAPPKHLISLCNQMVNFLGILQNEWAGAQAFSSFDTYLAPFVKVDNLTYDEVKQAMQTFIFGVNIPSRWGTQAPFSNITLDWTCPDDLKNLPALVGGKEMDFTYGDCVREMAMVNKAFIEVMVEGDYNGRGFAYPIPTYSITKDFDWSDTENNRLLFAMAAKYGTPYFSNYINSDMQPSDVRSMCCRLRLDLRELRKQNGGNFGAGENTGSIGVVTINMPRIAYLAKNEVDFFRRLEYMMDISARALDIKRKVINKYMDMGLYPYTKRYLPDGFVNHFSTIGLVGMNEACLNASWIGKDLTAPESAAWTEKVLDFMREKLSDYQEQYGNLFNLEATPAESTAYRLAKHDRALYPDIITAGKPGETPYYTNSSHLPVGATDDVFDALDIQDNLQTKYTSGTVFHCFLGERLPDWKAAMQLVRTVAENYKLPYFTLSPVYSVCEEHGYLDGEQHVCPHCGRKTEVYSRITGYYRPVGNWNDGKLQEFMDRKSYDIKSSYAAAKQEFLKNASAMYANVYAGGQTSGVHEDGEMHGDAGLSGCTDTTDDAGSDEAQKGTVSGAPTGDRVLLFTTQTCPKCSMLKANHVLEGIELTEVDASDPSNRTLVGDFEVMSAPTLVVIEDGTVSKYTNASEIMGFAQTRR